MSNPNYSIEVISHHPKFKNKSLRKYIVDGIETIGAWGNEKFEIKFTNHSSQKIQVKLSLDGTDILTGEPATTDITKDMWVVNGYETLSLKAWPESHHGGAAFIFTNAANSVALHVHGDMSSRGIIAAAVYVESHIEPIRLIPQHYYNHYYNWWYPFKYDLDSPYPIYGSNTFGVTYNGSTSNTINLTSENNFVNTCSFNASAGHDTFSNSIISKELENLVAIGAGEHVAQNITYVAGLIKPLFTESVKVRFLWWDELVAKLKENNIPVSHSSGFPGDSEKNIIDLKHTPRVGNYNKQAFPRDKAMADIYLRV